MQDQQRQLLLEKVEERLRAMGGGVPAPTAAVPQSPLAARSGAQGPPTGPRVPTLAEQGIADVDMKSMEQHGAPFGFYNVPGAPDSALAGRAGVGVSPPGAAVPQAAPPMSPLSARYGKHGPLPEGLRGTKRGRSIRRGKVPEGVKPGGVDILSHGALTSRAGGLSFDPADPDRHGPITAERFIASQGQEAMHEVLSAERARQSAVQGPATEGGVAARAGEPYSDFAGPVGGSAGLMNRGTVTVNGTEYQGAMGSTADEWTEVPKLSALERMEGLTEHRKPASLVHGRGGRPLKRLSDEPGYEVPGAGAIEPEPEVSDEEMKARIAGVLSGDDESSVSGSGPVVTGGEFEGPMTADMALDQEYLADRMSPPTDPLKEMSLDSVPGAGLPFDGKNLKPLSLTELEARQGRGIPDLIKRPGDDFRAGGVRSGQSANSVAAKQGLEPWEAQEQEALKEQRESKRKWLEIGQQVSEGLGNMNLTSTAEVMLNRPPRKLFGEATGIRNELAQMDVEDKGARMSELLKRAGIEGVPEGATPDEIGMLLKVRGDERGAKLEADKFAAARSDSDRGYNLSVEKFNEVISQNSRMFSAAERKAIADLAKANEKDGLPPKVLEDIGGSIDTLSKLDAVLKSKIKGQIDTGPIVGRWMKFKAKIGLLNPDEADFASKSLQSITAYIFQMTGKQMSKVESERIQNAIFAFKNTNGSFRRILLEMKRTVAKTMANRILAYNPERYDTGYIQGIIDNADEVLVTVNSTGEKKFMPRKHADHFVGKGTVTIGD